MPEHTHHRGHGHAHDRGPGALIRYLRLLPQMWQSGVGREVVGSVAPQAGECVVDLGAGMGSATVVAARSGASVVAVDPTTYMRSILRLRRRWQRNRDTITVVDGAAESIPLADASVDALWTVNTIHHWTQRNAACREVARVMRPRGRVLLVDEDFDDPTHPEHQRWQTARSQHGFEELNPEVLAETLRGAGFASAEGVRTTIAGRPAKVVRATR